MISKTIIHDSNKKISNQLRYKKECETEDTIKQSKEKGKGKGKRKQEKRGDENQINKSIVK